MITSFEGNLCYPTMFSANFGASIYDVSILDRNMLARQPLRNVNVRISADKLV